MSRITGNTELNKFQRCPYCKEKASHVIESRKTQHSRRRRKHCNACGRRETTHEVSEEFYKNAIKNLETLNRLRAALLGNEFVTNQSVCDECVHWIEGECNFDFPEAGGTFANECSMFETQQ